MSTHIRSGRGGRYPLTMQRLEALALRYVERYATSREKLARYLRRKIYEHGWDGTGEPPVAALVERVATLGYVDDRQFAESRARTLTRRGYGRNRIGQALAADGIAAETRDAALEETDDFQSALALARRRRLGPFGTGESTPEKLRRDIGILLRAGHDMALARRVASARTPDELDTPA